MYEKEATEIVKILKSKLIGISMVSAKTKKKCIKMAMIRDS